MPAPFVPNPDYTPTVNPEAVNLQQPNFNGQSPMHHAHPSAATLASVGYPESNTSSPAPRSAGNEVPYAYQHHQQPSVVGARHGAHLSNGGPPYQMSNGYSPMGPPPPGFSPHPEGNMHPGPDPYRRHRVSFMPTDGFTPSGTPVGVEGHRFNGFDPQTPRTNGSQSSAPSEQEHGAALYGQYPTEGISNGSNGHFDDAQAYQQSRPTPYSSAQNLNNLPLQMSGQPLPVDTLDGLVNYLQHQASYPEFTDYTLELRYTNELYPPSQRLPGHGLLLARSPTLKTLMIALARESRDDRTLLLKVDDRFVQPDGFLLAFKRLYGEPLLDINILGAPHLHSPMPVSVSSSQRFDLALGYAASGHILQMPPVITRGIEIACGLVNWDTLEKALDFALDGGLDSQWTQESSYQQPNTPSTYGPMVNMLIKCILDFIVHSFPPKFQLDGSVDDSAKIRRLPASPGDRSSMQNDRVRSVKFGDHTQESVRPMNPMMATLSKILLNLPFHLLKYVLESQLLGNGHWSSIALRQKLLVSVITERENRRTKVYRNLQVPNAERKKGFTAWQAVGWQEYVEIQGGGGEGYPVLARKQVEFLLPANQD